MLNTENLTTFKKMKEDTSVPPIPIIGNGILLDNTMLTIVGPPKIGKTFLIFDLAIAIATGTQFLGTEIRERKSVLILSAEGGYFPNRDRVKHLSKEIGSDNLDNVAYIPSSGLDLEDDSDVMELIDLIKQEGFQVLIIDPFIRVHHADENSASGMSDVFSKIRQIMDETKVALILVHHTGKNEYNGARGSSVIASEYDSCLTLRETNSGVQAIFDMRHVETPDNMNLMFNSKTLRFEILDSANINSDTKLVEELLTEPKSRPDIIKALRKDGLSKTPAYNLIKAMIESGKLEIVNDKLTLSEASKN